MLQSKLAKLMTDKRTLKAAVLLGILAIGIIFLSSFIKPADNSQKLSEEYASKTEERLLQIVSQIDGVGQAQIFLTMDNSGESVYLKNSDTKTLSIEPKVRGVVVVCEGGDDPVVVSRVLEAVTKSLCISSDKVCICR